MMLGLASVKSADGQDLRTSRLPLTSGPTARDSIGRLDSVRLTLRQAIAQASSRSPSALAAIHRYRASYWQYITFKSDYRPSLDLDMNPIVWERTIAQQTLPDGTDAFVPRSQANSSVDLSLSKVISWTGGRLSIRSEIARTDALEGGNGLQYFTTPVLLSFDQPLLAFNSYAWALRIEPKRYAESRQQFVEDIEGICSTAITYFFDLLTAQTALSDAGIEKGNADTLFVVAQRRFRSRKAPEDDLLQAELASLNADLRLTRARFEVVSKQQRLGSFLGLEGTPQFDLVPATDIAPVRVDLATAIREAKRNRPLALSFDRQLLETDQAVALARASRGSTSLTAKYGLSGTATGWSQLYRDPRVDQLAQISIRTPILDWGRSRARIAVAESQQEVTRRQIQQAKADFERDIFVRVSEFEIQARQLRVSAHADSVAYRRHQITRERYLRAEGDLNSVNIAKTEKDRAREAYLDAMRNYWSALYELRRATLYDFERGEPIQPPPVEF
jgi:outer membrane protein